MPQTLVSRDSTTRHRVQVARAVRGTDANALEIAIAHLAAGRVHAPPASLRYYSIGTTQQTFQLRIANPLAPEWAIVYATLGSDSVASGVMRASSDTTGLTTFADLDWTVGGGVENAATLVIPIEIGTGAVEAPAYEEVRLILDAADSGVFLHSFGVLPLALLPPQSNGDL